jgi:hypothetical protein
MTIVDDFIAAELVALVRITTQPQTPFAYGRDLSCTSDVTARFTEVDGTTALAIAESTIRRWTCPRGGLPDDPNYGIDVRGMLNRGVTTAELQTLASELEGEAMKDDRVDFISVSLALSSDYRTLTISAVFIPVDPALRDFAATFAVTDGATTLELMSR